MSGNIVPIHGMIARTEKNSVVMDFTEGWEINVELEMASKSRQGQTWKEILPGQAGWSGSIAAQLVLANTEQAALLANLVTATPGTKLTDMNFNLEDQNDYFSGDLYITGMAVTSRLADGTIKVSWPFQGDGALAINSA